MHRTPTNRNFFSLSYDVPFHGVSSGAVIPAGLKRESKTLDPRLNHSGMTVKKRSEIAASHLKTILLFLLLSTFYFPLSTASAAEISPDFAKVQKPLYGWNGKTLFLIQESHVDYEGQKAIVEILQSLIHQESLRLVMVEGGWEDMNLSYLRNYASDDSRRQIADDFLKQGKISAEEFLDITSNHDLVLWGIENPVYYKINHEAFLSLSEKQERLSASIQSLSERLTELKKSIHSKDLAALDSVRSNFQSEKSSLIEYLLFLKGRLQDFEWEKFPNLQNLFQWTAVDDTAALDISIVEGEKFKALGKLTKKLSKLETENLQALALRKTPEEELEFLRLLFKAYEANPKIKKPKTWTLLHQYETLLKKTESLDLEVLHEEIDALEQQYLKGLKLNSEEKTLWNLSEALYQMKQLFQLQLSPREFQRLEQDQKNWDFKGWDEWLKTKETANERNGETAPIRRFADTPTRFADLEKEIPPALDFYRAAMTREQALILNTMAKMKKEPDAVAAVITGGFHADEMSRAFHEKGYTVVKITPRFTPENAEEHQKKYFRMLKLKTPSL